MAEATHASQLGAANRRPWTRLFIPGSGDGRKLLAPAQGCSGSARERKLNLG
ncbi:hypothetical protein SNOG_02395 [Parastagonospora nodorum SN15]|uniref:Uncharacterized protein n=1 Tax=Phaeosphaeria nodorum (strain SN15 / ATCC MYA-4574 / FGSC 10173) TaxID=321614 RepID=Q0V0R9_PHANO|nr:hypothetical protein SNOG_02395 [Parastagonospora nodorum SN15]EAT90607.1 hypothetical protein SNOG_02395 [Parastagonospora nodorum SN15]